MGLCYKIKKILSNVYHHLVCHISLNHRILGAWYFSNQTLKKIQVLVNYQHWPMLYRSTQFNLLNLLYEVLFLWIEFLFMVNTFSFHTLVDEFLSSNILYLLHGFLQMTTTYKGFKTKKYINTRLYNILLVWYIEQISLLTTCIFQDIYHLFDNIIEVL